MDLEKRLEHWIIGRLYVSRLCRNHIDAGNRRNEIQVGSVLVVENSISQMADNAMENENAPTDPLEHSNVHSDRILLGRKVGWRAILIGTGYSLIIEITQLVTHRGLFEIDDLIHNTAGAAIGFGLCVLMKRIKRNDVR